MESARGRNLSALSITVSPKILMQKPQFLLWNLLYLLFLYSFSTQFSPFKIISNKMILLLRKNIHIWVYEPDFLVGVLSAGEGLPSTFLQFQPPWTFLHFNLYEGKASRISFQVLTNKYNKCMYYLLSPDGYSSYLSYLKLLLPR